MPTYSYECKKCGSVFDLFHSISATPRVRCEGCGGTVRRLIGTGAGIIFKGSGFYETDYRRNTGGGSEKGADGKSAAGKSESDAAGKPAGKGEGKSESKGESKPSTSSGKASD
jgi:putative FmdB family regulatory protein